MSLITELIAMHKNFDQLKFKSLVHYVCRTCIDPRKLSATKLHKILWLSDVFAYKHYGQPITGETYIKKQWGPFSSHLNSVLSHLEKEGRMFIHEVEWGEEKRQRQFVAKGDVDISLLSKDQLKIINDVRDYVCENHTASSISDKSHDDIWQMALMEEVIPYEALLVSRFVKPTDEDIEWAKSVLKNAT